MIGLIPGSRGEFRVLRPVFAWTDFLEIMLDGESKAPGDLLIEAVGDCKCSGFCEGG